MDRAWFDMVRTSALGWTTSVEMTYDVCKLALERDIPGEFVECGVYAGAQAAIMAMALLDHQITDRRVHLFDSFEGIPVAGSEDHELQGKPAGISACSVEQVKNNMERWGVGDWLLVYHPGWFEQTTPKVAGYMRDGHLGIAVLRLDGDLYRSTKVCMEHLYPLVSKGGYIIVDDFNLSGCRQAIIEAGAPGPIYWRKHE